MKNMLQNAPNDYAARVLFVLNLLSKGMYSKNQIMEEFKKRGVEVKRTSVVNYISALCANDIPISKEKIKNENYYTLKEQKTLLELEERELEAAGEVKKLLIFEKKFDIIRKAMRAFYKFALFVEDEDTIQNLVNFSYYSKINWKLTGKLLEHCKNKDVIVIDYLMPQGKNKFLTIHADTIKAGNWSNRIYLSGVLEGDNKISQLPVDKIFMIKKLKKPHVRYDMEIDVLEYKISKEAYEKTELEKNETFCGYEGNLAVIRRPIEDDFFVVQRLLYFCPDLYYISDEKIRALVLEKLNILKDMYEGSFDE